MKRPKFKSKYQPVVRTTTMFKDCKKCGRPYKKSGEKNGVCPACNVGEDD